MALKIKVERGKYVVVDKVGQTERPATNWHDLTAEARAAVVAEVGHCKHVGYYDCPEHLARMAW